MSQFDPHITEVVFFPRQWSVRHLHSLLEVSFLISDVASRFTHSFRPLHLACMCWKTEAIISETILMVSSDQADLWQCPFHCSINRENLLTLDILRRGGAGWRVCWSVGLYRSYEYPLSRNQLGVADFHRYAETGSSNLWYTAPSSGHRLDGFGLCIFRVSSVISHLKLVEADNLTPTLTAFR